MALPTRLILLRHAEPNARGAAKVDARLSARGQDEARRVGVYLALDPMLRSIHTSSLPRARETAEIVASATGAHLHVLPEIQEVHLGEWEGLEPHEIRRRFPLLVEQFKERPEEFIIPGGEPVASFQRRLRDALSQVVRQMRHGDTVVIVAHRVSIAFMICQLTNQDMRMFTNYMPSRYCSITVLRLATPVSFALVDFDREVQTVRRSSNTGKDGVFFGLSFSIAAACFSYAAATLGPFSLTSVAWCCFLISMSGYLRYLLKVWRVWMSIPPLTAMHELVNWALMIVGSASAFVVRWPAVFYLTWSLCYALVALKESLAYREHVSRFIIHDLLTHLRRKSRWAIAKAVAAAALALGATSLPASYQLGLASAFLTYSVYALARDLWQYWGPSLQFSLER